MGLGVSGVVRGVVGRGETRGPTWDVIASDASDGRMWHLIWLRRMPRCGVGRMSAEVAGGGWCGGGGLGGVVAGVGSDVAAGGGVVVRVDAVGLGEPAAGS